MTFKDKLKCLELNEINNNRENYFMANVNIIFIGLNILMFTIQDMGFYKQPINSLNMTMVTWLYLLATATIPIFLISMGYLNYKIELTFVYYYKLLFSILCYISLSFIFKLIELIILNHTIHIGDIFLSIFNYQVSPFAWYMEIYFGIYLLIPIINGIWEFFSKSEERLLILIILFILCILPSITNVYDKIFPTFFQNLYPIFYYLMGVYYKTEVEDHSIEKSYLNNSWKLFIVVSLITLIQNIIMMYDVRFEERNFNQYSSYSAFLIGLSLFLICKKHSILKLNYLRKIFMKDYIWLLLFGGVVSKILLTFFSYEYFNSLNIFFIFGATIVVYFVSILIFMILRKLLVKVINIKNPE